MTRRSVTAALVAPLSACLSSCVASHNGMCEAVSGMETSEHIMVFRRDYKFTLNGARLKEFVNADILAISPRGRFVVWSERRSLLEIGNSRECRITVLSPNEIAKTIRLPGQSVIAAAVSDDGSVVTIVYTSEPHGIFLLSVSGTDAERTIDLTPLAAQLRLEDISHLSLSSSGTVLAVSTRAEFVLADLAERKVLSVSRGSHARVSPDGTLVAFVNDRSDFMVASVRGGSARKLSKWLRVQSVGSWSPNGQFVLLGAFRPFAFTESLMVLNAGTGEFCEKAVLGQDDAGNRFFWISGAFFRH